MSPADLLPTIGLAELDAAAALLVRVDRKYVVLVDDVAELCQALVPTHRTLEIDGLKAFTYASEYYDSLDLRCLRDHVQGRRRRFKCRTRRYVDAGTSMFEVKLRGPGGRTHKHRFATAGEGLDADAVAFLRERLVEAYGRLPEAAAGPLAASLEVDCSRTTLVASQLGERLTIDWTVGFRGPDGATGRLRPGWVVLESKSAGPNATADRVLRSLGCRPVGMCSKYGLGLAMTRPGLRPAPLRPLLRSSFEPILTRSTS